MMRIVVAITGASGVVLGKRLVEELGGHEVHLVVTGEANTVAGYESTDITVLDEMVEAVYDEGDFSSRIASSSYIIDGMVVCPASMKTLSAIANGYTNNLVSRAADNCLKMNWPLIIVPRETPLSLPALENMVRAKKAGAVVLPAMLSYYNKPETVEDMTGFIVGKVLDCLGIENQAYERWAD